ncbi:conjugal transfer protein [Cronobacter sakazakii]|nr:conjugal transfer protein [Cronobacter sakazakii]
MRKRNAMKKISLYMVGFLVSTFAIGETASTAQVLTGDPATACEAILCLSTGKRPDECDSALTHFFKIKGKDFKETLKKRKKFLKLCPASNEPGMPQLTNAIANGAGRCDPAYLNSKLKEIKVTQVCQSYGGRDGERCSPKITYRISDRLPSYCQVYLQNQFTDLGLKYVGESRWQTLKSFNSELAGKWVN